MTFEEYWSTFDTRDQLRRSMQDCYEDFTAGRISMREEAGKVAAEHEIAWNERFASPYKEGKRDAADIIEQVILAIKE
jgi:hypothetical protein